MTRKGYPEGIIGQHTLYEARVMNERKYSKLWRAHPGMLVMMPEEDEKWLHRELPGLPRPSMLLAFRALDHLTRLPDHLGRLEKFTSVTNFMHDLADRWPHTPIGEEARVFGEHFQDQKTFFRRALTKKEEDEVLLLQKLAVDLADTSKPPSTNPL
jgi:hypothetical protein